MDSNAMLYLAVFAAIVFAVLYLAAIVRTDRAARQIRALARGRRGAYH